MPLTDRVRTRVSEERAQWSPARWKEVLACLSPEHRRVVADRLFHGLSFVKVAAITKRTESAVFRMWWQAIAKIREAHPELREFAHI